MIRRHQFRNEVCYVVRRPNGVTVSVPAWMTQPQAATVEIVPHARSALDPLLELRRLTTIYLSSLASRTHEGGPNVGRRGKATASIRRKAAAGAGKTSVEPPGVAPLNPHAALAVSQPVAHIGTVDRRCRDEAPGSVLHGWSLVVAQISNHTDRQDRSAGSAQSARSSTPDRRQTRRVRHARPILQGLDSRASRPPHRRRGCDLR